MAENQTGGFADQVADGLKKILYAGVGAVAAVTEKTGEVVEELIKKGELTVEQGKVVGEELKRNLKDKCAEMCRDKTAAEEIIATLELLTPEERAAVKAKLASLETQPFYSPEDEQ